jgi:hypothetical protein
MGESSSAPRAADSPTGAAHRLGADEAHPASTASACAPSTTTIRSSSVTRGLGGDRLLEQRPPPEVGEQLRPLTVARAGARRQDQTCIQAGAS